MRYVKTFALILGLLAAAAGCRSSRGPYPATMAKGTPPAESHSILYLTRSLQNVLHVTGERASRSPTNRMVVEVTFMNTQPKPLNVQIRTTFQTEDGAETGKTNFQNFMLAAHETKAFRVTSMNDRPDRYLMQVRRLSD
jgi:hypothetical protein